MKYGFAFGVIAALCVGAAAPMASASTINTAVTKSVTIGNNKTVRGINFMIGEGYTLGGSGGTIVGDVSVNGGALSPGESPGTMTIDGDLDLNGAELEIEIGGTGEGEFDRLIISGNFSVDSGTVVSFVSFDGFEPQEGDLFPIFDVAGDVFFGDATFDFSGLIGVADAALVNVLGGSISLEIERLNGTDPMSPVPLPAGGLLLLAALGLLGVARSRRV